MAQNGQYDDFGQNDLIPNRIVVFARPKWTKMVHFGPFWPNEVYYFGPLRSANRTLATPEYQPFSLILCRGESVEAEFSHWFWRHRGSILNFRSGFISSIG